MDCDRQIIKNLHFLELLQKNNLFAAMSAFGIHPGQMPVIEYVARHPGVSQREIADALYCSPASVATSTKRMMQSGLLKKSAVEESLRCNSLTLTEKGAEAFSKCQAQFQAVSDDLFAGITDDEKALLLNLSERMIRNLSGPIGETDRRKLIGDSINRKNGSFLKGGRK